MGVCLELSSIVLSKAIGFEMMVHTSINSLILDNKLLVGKYYFFITGMFECITCRI